MPPRHSVFAIDRPQPLRLRSVRCNQLLNSVWQARLNRSGFSLVLETARLNPVYRAAVLLVLRRVGPSGPAAGRCFTSLAAGLSRLELRRREPRDEQELEPEHERRRVPVPAVGQHEAPVAAPVSGRGRPALVVAQLELTPVCALDLRRVQLVPELDSARRAQGTARGGGLPAARFEARRSQYSDDEAALSRGVRSEIFGELPRKPQLQRLVLGHERGIAPKRIAEGKPLTPQVATRLGEMEPARRRSNRRLREMVGDPRPVWRVDVRLLAKRSECCPCLVEVPHSCDDIDDRLRRKAGDGCRADVVDVRPPATARARAPAARARPRIGAATERRTAQPSRARRSRNLDGANLRELRCDRPPEATAVQGHVEPVSRCRDHQIGIVRGDRHRTDRRQPASGLSPRLPRVVRHRERGTSVDGGKHGRADRRGHYQARERDADLVRIARRLVRRLHLLGLEVDGVRTGGRTDNGPHRARPESSAATTPDAHLAAADGVKPRLRPTR